MKNNQKLEKNWKNALHFFDELLRKNNLPTDKIWIGVKNQWLVDCSDLNKEQCTIAGVPRNKGTHLFLNLEYPSENYIQHRYKDILSHYMNHDTSYIMFYAVTTYKGNTICALITLCDYFHESDNDANDFQVWPDNTHVFLLYERVPAEQVLYISDSNTWAKIRQLPVKLSYLDYLANY